MTKVIFPIYIHLFYVVIHLEWEFYVSHSITETCYNSSIQTTYSIFTAI